jgi:hypothetical protein
VPTVADRVAQMVVKQVIEPDLDPAFLPDSGRGRLRSKALTKSSGFIPALSIERGLAMD